MCATTKNERERAYWAANVEPILGDDVEVHGECPQDQKADLLARASALLFPIQWEERFSADAMVAGYEDVYQRVLTMGPQHSGSYVALTCSPRRPGRRTDSRELTGCCQVSLWSYVCCARWPARPYRPAPAAVAGSAAPGAARSSPAGDAAVPP